MIKYTIQEIIAWAPTFSFLEIVTQKDACAASSGTWDFILTLIQKGGLCPLSLLPLMTVLCVYSPSGYSTREQLDRRRFFEGLENHMENKNKGNNGK